ncbi:phage major capsid protein [Streptomyces sp. NPDC005775]|uniref:phage major capsid family protein n=1 Tax=Streptomyces sp. NPDC005775 TaxID=3364729 RepID=UPI0036CBA488
MTLDVTKTSHAIAVRDRAIADLKALTLIAEGRELWASERARESELLATIARHDKAAKDAIDNAATRERAQAHDWTERNAFQGATPAGTVAIHADKPSRRSDLSAEIMGTEVRAYSDAPQGDTFSSTVLRGSDGTSKILGRVQTFEFERSKGMVPTVPRVTASLSAEGASLIDAVVSGNVAPFETVKVAAFTTVDRDDLQDYSFVDQALSDALSGGIGERIDVTLVAGGTDGVNTVSGFLDVGVSTAPTAALALVDMLTAVARVTDGGGTADVVFMSAQGKAAFLAANAGKLAGLDLPEIVAIGKLDDDMAAIDDDSFIVADLSKVAVAVRKTVDVSMHVAEESLYSTDTVALVGTARISGVVVANAAHVQIVSAA